MTIDSILTIGYYNGFDAEIIEIYNYIKKEYNPSIKHGNIGFPDFLSSIDINQYLRIMWSYIVLEYGDYGTSPRFGWINNRNVNIVLEEFEKIIKRWNDS